MRKYLLLTIFNVMALFIVCHAQETELLRILKGIQGLTPAQQGYGRQKQLSYTQWFTSDCYKYIQYRYALTWKGMPGNKSNDGKVGGIDAYTYQIKNNSNKVIELYVVFAGDISYRRRIQTLGGGPYDSKHLAGTNTHSFNPGETIEYSGSNNSGDKVVFEIIGVKILNMSDKLDWAKGKVPPGTVGAQGHSVPFEKCSNGQDAPWCEIYRNSCSTVSSEMCANWKENYDKWCSGANPVAGGNTGTSVNRAPASLAGSLVENAGRGNSSAFEKYFTNLGYKYLYHEGLSGREGDMFEHFSISHLGDKSNFVFWKGKEQYMADVLSKLADIKDYITFYINDGTIKSNGFAITKVKGHTTQGHGSGVEEDYNYILKVAKSFATQGVEANNSRSSSGVNTDYASVLTVAKEEAAKETEQGYAAAAKLLEPYAYTMNGEDLNNLGFYFWKLKDYGPAVKYYRMSGDKGNDWGNNNLALCYQNGWGVEVDNTKAFQYYSKVSSSYENIAETYHQLGHTCSNGGNNTKGEADYIAASRYYIMGSELNNASCMFHLGELYDKEGLISINLPLAKYWYKKACDLNEEKACAKLKALQ